MKFRKLLVGSARQIGPRRILADHTHIIQATHTEVELRIVQHSLMDSNFQRVKSHQPSGYQIHRQQILAG